MKDSTLLKISTWNDDGTLSSLTEFNMKGEVWNREHFSYEKTGNDSIITSTRGIFGNHKYFINENKQVCKYAYARDSSFSSILYEMNYEYDRNGNFLRAFKSKRAHTGQNQIWSWQSDSTNLSAQTLIDDHVLSTIYFNRDSCYVHVKNEGNSSPNESFYYFDLNGYLIKIVDNYAFKRRVKSDCMNYERNANGEITRQYGTYLLEYEMDIKFSYNSDGLIRRKDWLSGKVVFNFNYVYKS